MSDFRLNMHQFTARESLPRFGALSVHDLSQAEMMARRNITQQLACTIVGKKMERLTTADALVYQMSVYVLTDAELDALINRRIRRLQEKYGLVEGILLPPDSNT